MSKSNPFLCGLLSIVNAGRMIGSISAIVCAALAIIDIKYLMDRVLEAKEKAEPLEPGLGSFITAAFIIYVFGAVVCMILCCAVTCEVR